MGDLRSAIDSERAVHLCLDMQCLFGPDGPWSTPWIERVLPIIVALAEHTAERTIFSRFIPPMRAETAEGMWRAYYAKWRALLGRRSIRSFLIFCRH